VLSRYASHLSFRLAVFALLAAALVWPILQDAARINEFRDVHHLFLYERSAIDTIRHFHELPLWNPYYCGGFDAVGAPQTRFLSPTLLLGLWFGPERAEILTVFFFAMLGMEGTYRWLRLRVDDAFAAFIVAPVFALSGQFAVAYFRGWIQFFGFELVPWILFGITLAARRKPIGIAIAAIAFAVMVGFAGLFATPLLAVAGTIEGLRALYAQPRHERRRSFLMLAATASFMLTVAFVRLWPVAETLLSAPRIMAGAPGHLPKALLASLAAQLVLKDGNTDIDGSFFVGSAFLVIAGLGAQNKKGLPVLVIVFICLWLAAGYSPIVSGFALLRRIPMFTAVRYPERFLWPAMLFASELAAYGVTRMPLNAPSKKWRIGAVVILSGALVWTVGTEINAFHRIAGARTLGIVSGEFNPDFHQARGNRWRTVHFEAVGLGSLGCYETHRLAQSTLLRGDLPQEEYLAPKDAALGTVKRVAWSPNHITLHTSLQKPARVLVNQNWAPGWQSTVGQMQNNEGLLSVDMPEGEHDVTLGFRPWSTMGGAAVTGSALLGILFLVVRGRHKGNLFAPQRRIGTTLAIIGPWLVAGAAYASSPDPRWPPPQQTNPNGTPALVPEEAQALATPIGATFDVPIVLESAIVTGPDVHQNLSLELYLRRTGLVPRSTTMFVHFERRKDQGEVPKGKENFRNADHQIVGGSWFLSDMPEGRLIHDAFGAHLGKGASGVWDVWVAFGHVSGNRGRERLISPGKSVESERRVRIGTVVLP
jgi:hypothetical protein